MITFQEELMQPFATEAIGLFKEHYKELAEHTDVIKLKPNFRTYQKLYNMDRLAIHSVRDDGKLIGYNVWFLAYYVHAKDSFTATSDILYLSPEYRKGYTGYKFIQWSIEAVKKRKPQRIIFHVKPDLDYGPLLERLGADFFEKSYMIVTE